MTLRPIYNILLVLLLLTSVSVNGQNKITVKKSNITFDRIYQQYSRASKAQNYACFLKSGEVFMFNSKLNDKKVIQLCKNKKWQQLNALKGKYILRNDSIAIYPLTYSISGTEETNEFFYPGNIEGNKININTNSGGTESIPNSQYELFYPKNLTE